MQIEFIDSRMLGKGKQRRYELFYPASEHGGELVVGKIYYVDGFGISQSFDSNNWHCSIEDTALILDKMQELEKYIASLPFPNENVTPENSDE